MHTRICIYLYGDICEDASEDEEANEATPDVSMADEATPDVGMADTAVVVVADSLDVPEDVLADEPEVEPSLSMAAPVAAEPAVVAERSRLCANRLKRLREIEVEMAEIARVDSATTGEPLYSIICTCMHLYTILRSLMTIYACMYSINSVQGELHVYVYIYIEPFTYIVHHVYATNHEFCAYSFAYLDS